MLDKLIVVSAPSGAGKTTIVERALQKHKSIAKVCTHTTRQPRPQANERHGIDYYFVSIQDFMAMRNNNDFLETAPIYGHWYGTLKAEVQAVNNKGLVPVLVIDVQGAANIKKMNFPNIMTIFIRPPSYRDVEDRLNLRGTEDQKNLLLRLQNYEFEMNQMITFDVAIINKDIDSTVSKFCQIVDVFC